MFQGEFDLCKRLLGLESEEGSFLARGCYPS